MKKVRWLDITFLTIFYGLRIIVGSIATAIPLSQWLLSFIFFVSLSLAASKRVMELNAARNNGKEKIHGRNYSTTQRTSLVWMGYVSSIFSIVVLALYIENPIVELLYSQPTWLWIVVGIWALWLLRIWYLTARKSLQQDPVSFAISDRATYAMAIMIMIAGILAT